MFKILENKGVKKWIWFCFIMVQNKYYSVMYPEEKEITKELKRVSPKQGRVVIFDGAFYHTAEQPQKDVRLIINYNVI